MRARIPVEPARALYLCALTALFVLFFQVWRLILYLLLSGEADPVPGEVLRRSFLIGTRFDLTVSCYLVFPLALIAFLPRVGLGGHAFGRRVHAVALALLAGTAFLVQLADIEFFRFFNYRINGMALQWDETPGMVLSLLWQTYPVISYLLLFALLLAAFLIGASILRRNLLPTAARPIRLPATMAWGAATLALLVLGIRGTLEEKAPLAWGAAYFSEFAFANQLALNPNFTFARDVVYDADGARRVQEIMAEIGASTADDGIPRNEPAVDSGIMAWSAPRPVDMVPDNQNPPSVILVIMESFGASHIGALNDRTGLVLSPSFDSLAEQGILFTNFYSNGMHTYTGIISTLFGIPTMPGKSLMKRVVRGDNLTGLPSILRSHGYRTLFFTTHDPHFDNMQGFLKAHDFERIVSVFDYDPDEKMSTLGVPDHVMFDRAVDELGEISGRPYFATLLTSSNHGPWIIPEAPFQHVPGSLPGAERLNAFKYSDWSLGRFVRALRSDARLANTLIVITADNGIPVDAVTDLDPTQFHIPLLLIPPGDPGGPGVRVDRLGGQIDILPTVMHFVGLDYVNHSYGRNLLAADSTGGRDFAIFSEDFRVGYLEGDQFLVWRHEAPRSLFRLAEGQLTVLPNNLPVADELEDRALSLFHAAYIHVMDPPIAQHSGGPDDASP